MKTNTLFSVVGILAFLLLLVIALKQLLPCLIK